MTIKQIRKNATKKIKSYLSQAAGIIAETAAMQIDDSFDYCSVEATAADVLRWLENPRNYNDARVLLMGGTILRIGGPYHFSDCFDVYLDQDEFDREVGRGKAPESVPQAFEVLPSNIVSLCEYRKKLAG